MKKVKPAELTLPDGKVIYIVATKDDFSNEVDVKVVDEHGEDVDGGILVVIRPDGIGRIGYISEEIGLPLTSDRRLKKSKHIY